VADKSKEEALRELLRLVAENPDFFWRCFDSWFNVAEGGKRGGKNVLIRGVEDYKG